MQQPHEKTEYEFKAKQLLDSVKKRFPGMGAMVFLFDQGPSSHMAYLSNSDRVDCVTLILEWTVRALRLMTKEQVQEILHKIEKEWTDE